MNAPRPSRVWKYGDGVNTDVIYPGKYTYTVTDPDAIASHALEDLDPDFAGRARPGDVIVAGANWGLGSSREQAVTCLRHLGIRAVIAESFARIYFRNAINHGLLAIECPKLVAAVSDGDEVIVDPDSSAVVCRGVRYDYPPPDASTRALLDAGGLIAFTRRQLAGEGGHDVD